MTGYLRYLVLALLLLPAASQSQPAPTPISPLTGSEQFVLQYAPPSGCSVNCFTTSDAIKAFAGGGGGGSSFTAIAATALAAGTAVSLNSSGQIQQTWGPAAQINGTATVLAASGAMNGGQGPGVVALSATRFVAFAASILGANPATGPGAVAFSVSGNAVSVGTPSTSGGLQNMQSAAALDSSHFIYSYLDGSNNLYAQVGSISGNAITLGTAVEIAAGGISSNGQRVAFAILSSSLFVMSYIDNSSQNWVVAGSVSGTTITLGSPVDTNLPSAGAVNLKPAKISATSALLQWEGTNEIDAVVASVSGTTITINTVATLSAALAGQSSNSAPLGATSFVVTYGQGSSGSEGDIQYAVAGSISGTTISFGAPVLVNSAWYQPPLFISVLSPTVVAFYSGAITPTFAIVSGTTLTPTMGVPLPIQNVPPGVPFVGSGSINPSPGQAQNGLSTSLVFPAIVGVGATDLLFVDGFWNLYEMNASGTLSQTIAHPGIFSYAFAPISSTQALALLVDFGNNLLARVINFEPIAPSSPVGFVSSAYAQGATATVVTGGVISGFSALTPGDQYFSNGDGTLTTGNTGHPACRALTATTCAMSPLNYMLKRDLDPASNDNAPAFMSEAA